MSTTLTANGVTFNDGSTRTGRPLTIYATGSLTSSINSSAAASTDYVNITAGGGSGTNRGLPAVYVSFDYWTSWGYANWPWTWYVYTTERHLNITGLDYIRIGMFHGAYGGAHVYTISCLGYDFS
jgi:hypothetical protein